ncbi:acyl-CoA synthetase [uncultured Jatrophihabitans sp.]|uniref:acyl-CoA synthetase n=1 Tax=uncultured Jatrophihabitans sp. TaxID=1610747 RepID=UPI0035CBE72A
MFPGLFAVSAPDKRAAIIAETGRTLTYADLDRRSTRLAHHLRRAGLRHGDAVALITDNRLEAFEVYWAAMRSGLYLTAVNHHLAPDEVSYILSDSGAAGLIVSAAQHDLAEALEADGLLVQLAFGGPVPGFGDYEQALARSSEEPLGNQPRGAPMLYSSGTTGRPKGVRPPLPERQIDDPGHPDVALHTAAFGFGTESVYLSPAPIYHAAPLRYCASMQSVGGTVVMMEHFDASSMLSTVERYRVIHLQAVPTMFVRLLKLPEAERSGHDLSSLQVAIHAAAPCPPTVKHAMIDWWGPILFEYYAGTEANGMTLINSAEWLEHPGSVGTAILGVPHICGEDGAELPTGRIGLVYFEREELPFWYHRDPKSTRQAQHPRHPTWTTMGDVGRLDPDGYLYLTDRAAFTIISGGVNIYPQEIENALTMHPKVRDVAVVGVPDEEMGQRVKAFVQPAETATVGLAGELTEYLRERVAHFKVPREIDVVQTLPRTAVGKLAKRSLLTT